MCPEDGVSNLNLGLFLISFSGPQTEKGQEGVNLLEASDFPSAKELLGVLYQYGNVTGGSSYFSNDLVDIPKSIERYLESASQGNPDAAYALFELFMIEDDLDEDLLGS